MGRPREHDDDTRTALVNAAEQLVERGGATALSVRRVADEAGTTTRAVYTLFGSKAGLLDALGAEAFRRLADSIAALPSGVDPRAELIAAGATAFRGLVVEHPALFRVGIQQPKTTTGTVLTRLAADAALEHLRTLITRLNDAGLLMDRSIEEATWQFHAMCEGLAQLELRGGIPGPRPEAAWHFALGTLVDGLAVRT